MSGKSKSTIRRLIDEIVKEATSEARSKILPSAEDVERYRRRKEQYSWKISEDLLRERFAIAESEEGSEARPSEKGSDASLNVQIVELLRDDIATLKEQLDRKDGQLSEANQRLKEANERNREQNILLRDLQDRIPQLKSGRDIDAVEPVVEIACSSRIRPDRAPRSNGGSPRITASLIRFSKTAALSQDDWAKPTARNSTSI